MANGQQIPVPPEGVAAMADTDAFRRGYERGQAEIAQRRGSPEWVRRLTPLIAGIGALRGGNMTPFLRRWTELEAAERQRRAQEAQLQRQAGVQQQQLGMQRERLDLDRSAQDRLAEQQRINYTQSLQRLFTDESVDPDVALQLATMSPPQGYDVGAVQSIANRVFTPDERTRRKAEKRLKDIEADPRVKKLIAEGQDIAATTWEAPDIGGNPEDLEGQPRYTVAQLQRLAQKTVPSAPLPALPTTPSRPRSDFDDFWDSEYLPAVVEQRKAAGNTAPLTRMEIRDLKLQARERWNTAGRAPDDTTPSPSERRTAVRDRQADLRASLRDAL